MKRLLCLSILLLVLPSLASAAPVTGTYTSTDLNGGSLYTGRASTWRSGINSGLPHVLHAQSWDGTTLGTQWEISCPTENAAFTVQDNRVGGEGTIVYTSHFTGGTFTFYPGVWPWGDGSGTLGSTTLITTVQYVLVSGTSTPVASVVNGNTSGTFDDGCALVFGIGNGYGAGETTSLDPGITIPADYPIFLDGSCAAASAGQQYGSWGSVITITVQIDCSVPIENRSWSAMKAAFR
ncbi:MAG TPA: hypothetical protein VKA63_07630 [Candidatus Krumholzibacteria bacterium]|nr:hypothetical protein [Candidatus Krumholzibacteria bacterium]